MEVATNETGLTHGFRRILNLAVRVAVAVSLERR